MLDRLILLQNKLKETNSKNEKVNILKNEFQDLKEFIGFFMNPLKTTGISSNKLKSFLEKQKVEKQRKKRKMEDEKEFTDDIQILLQHLFDRKYTGHTAFFAVMYLLDRHPEKYHDIIYDLIDKDLKIRMDVKQINQAFPGLISIFSPALANDFHENQNFFNKKINERWFISRKFDGVRILVINDGKTAVKAFSRNGIEKKSLKDSLCMDISKNNNETSFVLDGEVVFSTTTTIDEKDNFLQSVGQVNKKEETMWNYQYHIFDCLTLDEFYSQESKEILSDRLKRLDSFDLPEKCKKAQQTLYSNESFKELCQEAEIKQWEGLMLRRDCPYQGKRSNDILKYKTFMEDEYTVLNVEISKQRYIDKKTGLEKEEDMLKSVEILYKNKYKVNVGSGFTLEQRQYYKQYPEKIIGKQITVKYYGELDETSLRFPILKYIWENGKRDL